MIPSSENTQPILKRIAQYEILRQIGQGAMGVVYEAIQSGLARHVALKILPTHLANDRTFLKRFQNEAEAAARMNHPNIATVYDYGQGESGPYIVMEYIQGRTLEEILVSEGLRMDQVLHIAESLAGALAYAHEHGIIHRDIKSANVMMDPQGRVVVMDFGLAKIENATLLTIDGTIMGTPAYMPPELIQPDPDVPITPAADIYSLGVLMYEMSTRELPFKAANHMAVMKKVLEDEPVHPRRLNKNISKDMEIIILRAMEKDPARRYASVRSLADDIKRLELGEPIWAKPTSVWIKVVRRFRKLKGILWALGITFLIGLIWTAFLIHRQRLGQVEYQKILHEAQTKLVGAQEESLVLLDKLSQDPLFHVLESRDPLMRAQAIIALNQKLRERELKGKLEKESFDLTLKALDDPHPLVRRHAAILLGILKDQRALDALTRRVEDEDDEVRKHAVLALGLLQNPKSVAIVLNCLNDANEEVRANSSLALGLLKAKDAVDPLIRALQDPFPKVRSNASASLGAIRDSKAILPLIKLLKDPVKEVQKSAGDALSDFGDESRLPVLRTILEDPKTDPKEIAKALRGLDAQRDKEILDSVLSLLNHSDSGVRYTSVLVLGLFQDKKAVPRLIPLLEDQDGSVRENARLALISLTGQDFGYDLKKWKEWVMQEYQKEK